MLLLYSFLSPKYILGECFKFYSLSIKPIDGKTTVIPSKRDYKINFRNTKVPELIDVFVNKDKLSDNIKTYEEDNNFIIEVLDVDTTKELVINCKGKDIEIDAVRVINDDVKSILLDLKINVYLKEEISDIMFSNQSISKKRIAIRKLRGKGLSRAYTNLFLKLLEYISEF